VKIDNGNWVDSSSYPSRFSVSGSLANGVATIYQSAALAVGAHTVTIRTVNDSGNSAEITRAFTVSIASFDVPVQYITIVTAAQMNSIRNTVNDIRNYYGIPAMQPSETIIAGRTQVRDWPLHIAEARAGVDGVVSLVNGYDGVGTFDIPTPVWIMLSGGYPQASVMGQIMTLIPTL
jgi:hypothetical protein